MCEDEPNDNDQESPEDFSPESNARRSRALERTARRVYENDRE